MTDKIGKSDALALVERKRKFLGIGIDFESDLESLRSKLRRVGTDEKELEKVKKEIKNFKQTLEIWVENQDTNIRQSELNIKIEEENIETAKRNKEFLERILYDADGLEL